MTRRLPVIVISGFLGSGKTTFLRYLLRNTNKQYGLIINEFGDVGIDGDLVRSCNECNNSSKCIIELNNGCLCCTVQDDFVPSIQALLSSNSEIEGIIIETSGLALPIPLLKALNWPEIRTLVYLDFVIGVVNGESMLFNSPINDIEFINNQYNKKKFIEHNSSIDELFLEQLSVSDAVLISRTDLLDEDQFNSLKNTIRNKIDPYVPIFKSANGEVDLVSIFDSTIQKKNHEKLLNEKHDHNHLELFSFVIKSDYFLEKQRFDNQIKSILKDVNFLRIKGRVWIPTKKLPLQVQIVGRKINTWYEESSQDCWRPINGGGMELILIGFEKESFEIFERKIKEKFNILSDPK